MELKESEQIGKIWFEDMWSKPDFTIADKIIDPEYKPDWINIDMVGPALVKYEIKQFRSIFHDLVQKVIEIKGEENKVWVWYRANAIHNGGGWGFEPTNKRIEFEGAALLFINSEGKVFDLWDLYCFYDVLKKLGVVPALGELHKYLSGFKK